MPLPNSTESHALAQAHGAQLFADQITSKALGNGVGQASGHFSVIIGKKMIVR